MNIEKVTKQCGRWCTVADEHLQLTTICGIAKVWQRGSRRRTWRITESEAEPFPSTSPSRTKLFCLFLSRPRSLRRVGHPRQQCPRLCVAPIESVNAEESNRQFSTNALGPLLVTMTALAHFAAPGGSIVNLLSVVRASPWF